LKNKLLKELKNKIYELLKEKMNQFYSDYIKYLIDYITDNVDIIDKYKKIVLLLNSRDYNFFNKNPDEIKSLFKNSIEINKAPHEFIGGFKIILSDEEIFYDFSIDNIINKNLTFIQKELSKIVSESEIKEIEQEFERFIQEQKLGIEEYLRKYD
jgi:vacuolar-type H+-ATPase subunit E/Vma4